MPGENGVLRPIEGRSFERDLTLNNEELDRFQMGMDAHEFLNHVGLAHDLVAVNRENFLR
ncbi:hypothetical protein CVD25_14820 [Bacillus canaveralius]|uniref:Uncharacterized protein n=1 Tax=Bacillus canaveralius TaxID=1403243 RepID=A0A2N5GHL8_9BACI|nr:MULTISPECIES: hypothetical protein [Bacillus]PLR80295.1 hypothetical protein CU635_18410 [Bacillus canaveralius]PLR85776.1 hypothetical protein CVD23_07485 [Bacillus sp. V33-4]PLR95486.1 hypothetical protein CVD25_14820 [Bacillus canaveralius]RSK53922.1 hypothetical protein EJA13_06740 [Bacillus canaveralius]